MTKKHRKGKGSAFERTISKQLSLWWTDGKRDDVFWRTNTSGARATSRNKNEQSTFGQYGDVQANDPIGQSLIDLCTIETKKGYGTKSYFDLIDKLEKETKQPYLKFIRQAEEQHLEAGSWSWLLITKRDRKETLIAMPSYFKKILPKHAMKFLYPSFYFRCRIDETEPCYVIFIFVTTLNSFLANITPKMIRVIWGNKY